MELRERDGCLTESSKGDEATLQSDELQLRPSQAAEAECIHYREGRPSFEQLVDGQGVTAVFTCGPDQMMRAVREAVSSVHYSLRCSPIGAELTFQASRQRVTVFEEVFAW